MACEIGSKRLIDINKTQSGRFMMVSDRPKPGIRTSQKPPSIGGLAQYSGLTKGFFFRSCVTQPTMIIKYRHRFSVGSDHDSLLFV